MAEGMDTVACHTFTKERQPQAMADLSYQQLISHPSEIMFRAMFNRLRAKAAELLAEEQVGLRPGRNTEEQ